ncbi:unnamed protein product [Rotaria sp. Silwood2]|nr:unnamed protein product [Rotaria sp. Silwood2]CAF2816125.1 unnamed protein product [Rotaria sp. Silwood2]CAF3935967.1 unnamed protein product [Rotaria sp. Silwood2]CAF4227551.1 unnamed protein product [Rotaria sp. Silwood2]
MSSETNRETGNQHLSTEPIVSGLANGHTVNMNSVPTPNVDGGYTTNTNGVISISNNNRDNATADDTDDAPPPPFKMPRAPPHVYSCFVVNRTDHPIECDVRYDGRPQEDTFNEDVHVTIPAKDEKYFPRKIFQPDLPESYCRWVKIITHIRVKKHDGKILEVDYPFDNVHAPIRNWEFHVRDHGDILSKPPTRPANILKYENLDEYER